MSRSYWDKFSKTLTGRNCNNSYRERRSRGSIDSLAIEKCTKHFFKEEKNTGAINFSVLPLVSALPHGTSFILALLSETIRSLSLCQETGRGRLGRCIHMLQLWFCSHLSIIARDQPIGFVCRNRVWSTIFLDLPFFGDTNGWLRYLYSLSPTNWTWRVKWDITEWQGQAHCVGLLGIPLVGI